MLTVGNYQSPNIFILIKLLNTELPQNLEYIWIEYWQNVNNHKWWPFLNSPALRCYCRIRPQTICQDAYRKSVNHIVIKCAVVCRLFRKLVNLIQRTVGYRVVLYSSVFHKNWTIFFYISFDNQKPFFQDLLIIKTSFYFNHSLISKFLLANLRYAKAPTDWRLNYVLFLCLEFLHPFDKTFELYIFKDGLKSRATSSVKSAVKNLADVEPAVGHQSLVKMHQRWVLQSTGTVQREGGMLHIHKSKEKSPFNMV